MNIWRDLKNDMVEISRFLFLLLLYLYSMYLPTAAMMPLLMNRERSTFIAYPPQQTKHHSNVYHLIFHVVLF